MNYYLLNFDLTGFHNLVLAGKITLPELSNYKLPEDLQELKDYFKKNPDPGFDFCVAWEVNSIVDIVLTGEKIDWAHAYSDNSSLYRYAQSDGNLEKISERLNKVLKPVDISVIVEDMGPDAVTYSDREILAKRFEIQQVEKTKEL